jgi:O-antigen/teichoic acid export membrane protein
MILACLQNGEFELGCYSLAVMAAAQLFGLGNMLAIATGPRHAELWGRTGSRRDVAELAARVCELQSVLLAPLACLLLLLGPALLSRVLPEYVSGLESLSWLVPGALALGASLPASQYLLAVEGGRRVLLVLLVAIGLAFAGNYLAISAGLGITGVAMATGLSNLAYLLLLSAVSLWLQLSGTALLRHAAGLCLALLPTAAVSAAAGAYRAEIAASWWGLACATGGVLGFWLLVLAAGWRCAGWSDLYRFGDGFSSRNGRRPRERRAQAAGDQPAS